jgi:hypothetical protein
MDHPTGVVVGSFSVSAGSPTRGRTAHCSSEAVKQHQVMPVLFAEQRVGSIMSPSA